MSTRVSAGEVSVVIDGTARAATALDRAAEQSRLTGVPLRVVYSWQSTATPLETANPSFSAASAADARARATSWVLNRLGNAPHVMWTLEIEVLNDAADPDVSDGGAAVRTLVIAAREDLEIVRGVRSVLD